MKKIAIGVAIISFLVFVIAWGVMGLEIFDGDYDIEMLVYIGATAWIVLLVSLVVQRWDRWRSPLPKKNTPLRPAAWWRHLAGWLKPTASPWTATKSTPDTISWVKML